MFKGTSVIKRNGEVKMESQDAKEGGVYKKKMVFIERGGQTQVSKRKRKKTRRTLREESEQCSFLYNIGLLRQACREIFAHLFYNIGPFFLIFILGQGPLLLFVFLSYRFY